MSEFLEKFPEREKLLEWYVKKGSGSIPDVNAHIHTPWSFSAFDDPEQAFIQASEEKVTVLGINDFNTTRGYDSFFKLGMTYRIFPLFNIEFMGLMREEQKNGVRINDPGNPGRIYFSGKGLDYPVSMGKGSADRLVRLREEGHRQVRQMTAKLNRHLKSVDGNLQLDFDEVERRYTKGMVRERHIARALRILVYDRYPSPEDRSEFLGRLFGVEPSSPAENEAAVENEIRSRLLKSGGAAFVEEDQHAFPGLDEIISVITDAGGIPCYPVLLDDQKGTLTEFEADPEKLCGSLRSRNVSCVELIPGRNDIRQLRSFVSFFRERGFVILFGTEHNTPAAQPLRVSARGGVPLDDELRAVNYEGACVIAAHQYLRAKGEEGYPSLKRSGAANLGKAVIEYFGKK
ncbi:MAG: hypothetical protein R6U58_04260 [Bacteroidales bacterium]